MRLQSPQLHAHAKVQARVKLHRTEFAILRRLWLRLALSTTILPCHHQNLTTAAARRVAFPSRPPSPGRGDVMSLLHVTLLLYGQVVCPHRIRRCRCEDHHCFTIQQPTLIPFPSGPKDATKKTGFPGNFAAHGAWRSLFSAVKWIVEQLLTYSVSNTMCDHTFEGLSCSASYCWGNPTSHV
jgi:hypothetical protein